MEVVDLGMIVMKLLDARVVKKTPTGYQGMFSIERHSGLLSDEELNTFLDILHKATPHGQECCDWHQFNFEVLQEH